MTREQRELTPPVDAARYEQPATPVKWPSDHIRKWLPHVLRDPRPTLQTHNKNQSNFLFCFSLYMYIIHVYIVPETLPPHYLYANNNLITMKILYYSAIPLYPKLLIVSLRAGAFTCGVCVCTCESLSWIEPFTCVTFSAQNDLSGGGKGFGRQIRSKQSKNVVNFFSLRKLC